MFKEYFSEKELGKKELIIDKINLTIFNGVITIYQKYHKNFAKEFPIYCPDKDATICGVNCVLLEASIKSQIPDLKIPLNIIHESDKFDEDDIDTYSVLDFIEYCYSKIHDVTEGDFHSYFGHYHYHFLDSKEEQEEFRLEINRLFERNGIVFYLDSDGEIKRHLPLGLDNLIKGLSISTSDTRLNELINLALFNIKNPKEINRFIALEKIWDAFERLKTYFQENKKKSIEQVVRSVGAATDQFDILLDTEFKTLTEIGNKYQIRHFEKDKIQIKSLEHVDYLFYRMLAVIALCISVIK